MIEGVCAVEVSLGFMCSCCSLNFESRIASGKGVLESSRKTGFEIP